MSVITQRGNSALLWAAFWGHTEIVQQLVKAGANLDLQNKVCQYVETHDVHEYGDNMKSNRHADTIMIIFTLYVQRLLYVKSRAELISRAIQIFLLQAEGQKRLVTIAGFSGCRRNVCETN